MIFKNYYQGFHEIMNLSRNRIKNFELKADEPNSFLECLEILNNEIHFNTHNICLEKSMFNESVIYFLQSMSYEKSMKIYNYQFNKSILNYLSSSSIKFNKCTFRDSKILINSTYNLLFKNCSLLNLQLCFNNIDIYIIDCKISNSIFHTSFPSKIHIYNCNFLCNLRDSSCISPPISYR